MYFDSGLFNTSINKLDSLINSYVKNDATAFYNYEQYEKSIPVLKEFGKLRAASVTAQLTGNTTTGTVSLDLSALGSMGGMGARGGINGGFGGNQDNQINRQGAAGRQNGNIQVPPANGQDVLPNDNANLARRNQGAVPNRQAGFPGGNIMGRGEEFNNNDTPVVSREHQVQFGIIIGICVLCMAGGIVFAMKFRRRRYAKGYRRSVRL